MIHRKNFPARILKRLGVFAALVSGGSLCAQAPGLYINEVSQGPGGSKEWVELLVVGSPTCYSIPVMDIRHWYLDDNNGNHAVGSGTGIAPGCIRFTNDPLWSAVPIGTIILIYNDADIDPAVPTTLDTSLTDGNCRIVIPVSSALLEGNATTPSTLVATYPTTGFTPGGLWTDISMNNTNDSFQTIDPSGNLFHSVSWGNNTLNDIIYFAGPASGMVAEMTNASNDDITQQANWTFVSVAGETPGTANNVANQKWICKMNNGCTAPTPIALATSQVNASCTCTGSATVTPSGGFTGCGDPYNYSWSPSGGNAATATGLCAGTYTVTVSDVAGCVQTQTVNIAAATPLSLTSSQTDVTCNGGNSGSATVTVSGGATPYTYSWSPAGGTNATANNLAAGSYTCTITDANNCTTTQTFSITEPVALSVSPSQANVLCNGGNTGTATVSVSGGSPGYTYSWTPSNQTTASATNLSATNYTCTITDASNCTISQTFSITEPAALSSSVTPSAASCNSADGSATVNASGGSPGYTYSWSSGGTGATENNLAAGNYTVTITDTNGCSTTATTTIISSGSSPVAVLSAGGPTSICQGDSVQLTASGGSSYSWSNGATTSSLYASAAGTYSVIVSNSCGSDTASFTITTTRPPVAQVTGKTTICAGQQTTLTASGGTSYLWSNGSTANSISVSTGGTYYVIASNSCGSDTAQLTVNVSTVIAGFNATPDTGQVPLDVTFTDNSVNANTWNWNFGDGNTSTLSDPSDSYQSPGVYTVTLTVTNADGCTDTATATIIVSDVPSLLIIPNVFTPNGDGTNDLFFITSEGLSELDVKIYDRWGVFMNEIKTPQEGWDGRTTSGKPATDGTYYYILMAKGYDGKAYNATGFVTLLTNKQ